MTATAQNIWIVIDTTIASVMAFFILMLLYRGRVEIKITGWDFIISGTFEVLIGLLLGGYISSDNPLMITATLLIVAFGVIFTLIRGRKFIKKVVNYFKS